MNNGPRAESVYPTRNRTAWITAQRPPRPATLDPFKPHGFFLDEDEPDSAVILLTNKECPWRCLMCDLWMNTTKKTVPPGAIPKQIEYALRQLRQIPEQIKLYNSGSFFDPAAIPPADYPAIAGMVAFARRVLVESHPRLIGEKALRFRDLIDGELEVAMGLETVHPRLLPLLNKKFDLADFSKAAKFLRSNGMAVRAFVLVQPPFLDEAESVEWAVKSVQFALQCGATVVSLIPTRHGNGAMERLMETGEFSPPRLLTLEKTHEVALGFRRSVRVLVDTWDVARFSRCPICLEKRRERMRAMNLSQRILPAVECLACGGA